MKTERITQVQARQDASDLRDVLTIVDIYRCPKCLRMGIRQGLICQFCRYDPSAVKS